MGKIKDTSAEDNAEQMVLQAGRRNPFTQVGDWILLANISRNAQLLYWALKAHVNTTRGDNEVWPTQATLAELLDFAPVKGDLAELRDGRKIRPFLKELVAIEAITIRKIRSPDGMRERSLYEVHETPPPEYDGITSLKQFYAKRNERIATAKEREEAARGVQGELDLGAVPVEKKPKRTTKRRTAA